MDQRVSAVLDEYATRLTREKAARGDIVAEHGWDVWRQGALLAVGPETAQLLSILVRSLDAPHVLELGTSFGYSTMWLAEAARAAGGRLTTMELEPHKQAHARDMAERAGLAEVIDFRLGDAVAMIGDLPDGIDFVLVDLWKDLYTPCLEAFFPKCNPGAIVVADNMILPGGDNAERYRATIRAKPGVSSVLLPVGTGIEVSRLAAGAG